MENKETFFARLETMLAPSELTMVKSAYMFAKFGHRAQVRRELDAGGEPLRYFEHVRRAAIIMIDELKIHDPELISATLLHDCIEDTDDITAELIEFAFGRRVAKAVRQVTNIPKEGRHERFKLASRDAVLVKFCDRLDNVRSLDAANDVKFAKRKALETTMHYIPVFSSHLKGKELNVLDELEDKSEQIQAYGKVIGNK